MMRKLMLIAQVLLLFFIVSCSNDDEVENYKLTEDFYLIPENPTSRDIISIVDEICLNFTLNEIKQEDNTIYYARRFNSAIMSPCVIEKDTVEIGLLSEGNYKIVYQLIDDAINLNADSIVETGSFKFTVGK